MAVAEEYARQLEQRIWHMQRRLSHTEIELAQARDSRDGMKAKLEALTAKFDEMGFEVTINEGE